MYSPCLVARIKFGKLLLFMAFYILECAGCGLIVMETSAQSRSSETIFWVGCEAAGYRWCSSTVFGDSKLIPSSLIPYGIPPILLPSHFGRMRITWFFDIVSFTLVVSRHGSFLSLSVVLLFIFMTVGVEESDRFVPIYYEPSLLTQIFGSGRTLVNQ